MKTIQRTAGVFLTLVMLVSLMASFTPAVYADTASGSTAGSMQLTVAEGAYIALTEGDTLQLTAQGGGTSYEWKKDGAALAAGQRVQILNGNTLLIAGVTTSDAGKYQVISAGQTYDVVVVVSPKASSATGGVEMLGYSVQDANGNELQKVTPGTKCRIVVALRDGRFQALPTQMDSYGNYVNVKLTSTSSFATPSFGDIKQTTMQLTSKGLEYAVIFNDITYVGGDNTLTFDLSYNDGSVPMISQSVGVSQCQTESQTGAKPTLMVREASFGGQSVEAGNTFTLSITSYNTSNSVALTDVTTSINLPSGLLLASGSNKVLTKQVAAGGSYTTSFQMQVSASAETGPVNVTVDYVYYISGSSEPLSDSQMITIPVVQPDRFSFTTMEVPPEAYTGQESYISLDFVNKGKGVLYNLSAEISGNMDNPGQTQYLGNLQSGSEGSVEFSVLASTAGTVNGTITLTYEDVNGNAKTQSKEFSMTVMEMPNYDDMYPMDPGIEIPEETGFVMPIWGWTLIAVGCVVVIVVVIRIVKKRKAKKIAQQLAEDDDDEDF